MDAAREEMKDEETEDRLVKQGEYDADEELDIVVDEESLEELMIMEDHTTTSLSSDVGAAGPRGGPRSEEELAANNRIEAHDGGDGTPRPP